MIINKLFKLLKEKRMNGRVVSETASIMTSKELYIYKKNSETSIISYKMREMISCFYADRNELEKLTQSKEKMLVDLSTYELLI